MLFAKRSKKGNPVAKADEMKELPVAKAKEGGIPLSVKATLSSAKKVPSVSAKEGKSPMGPVAKEGGNPQITTKDPGHSEAYMQRMKKRLAK